MVLGVRVDLCSLALLPLIQGVAVCMVDSREQYSADAKHAMSSVNVEVEVIGVGVLIAIQIVHNSVVVMCLGHLI